MPLSVPGMKRWIGSVGQLGSTSAQVSAVLKISASCSNVTSVRNSFSWLTVTASASVPTRNSIGVRPMAAQDSIRLP